MSRIKIDYGIDLGTTNSSIARMEHGNPVIKKTDTLKDTLPSCVTFNRRQMIQVGDGAYTQLDRDRQQAQKNPDYQSNTFIEFKRTMGTKEKFHSSNMNKDYSSEELSAEVLKKLKSFITDENISSIVITVPAKFNAQQNDSTLKAAKLAGFKHVELLQEPIAASMAYGLDSRIKDGFWLVFDFGGGTFDAALLKLEDGVMAVKDTEGDNWLGGKNIDYAIIDEIVIPYFKKHYSIDSILSDNSKLEIFRNAWKAKVEKAKIALSFEEVYTMMTDLGEDFGQDDEGQNFELDIEINQKELEKVISPIYQKAIDLCKELLNRNHLLDSDLSALILIGGPTFSPIVRNMLRDQITEKVDISVDPMTAVAKGAALFASTLSISDEVIEENRDKTKLQLEVKYAATSVDDAEWVTIKILKDKTLGKIPSNLSVQIERGDKAWSSGQKAIGDKAALVQAKLNANTSNAFSITLFDESGNRVECEPNQFNILQGITGGEATLPYHIGIEIADRILEHDVFIPVKGLEKNKELPVTGVINGLKTQRQIRPGKPEDFILIPIYQGDYSAEGTRALYNNHICDIKISGESLPALLPEGSEVEITIKVDRSQQMVFSAFFPLLSYNEEKKVELKSAELIDESWLNGEIRKAKKTAQSIKSTDQIAEIEKVSGNLSELESQLEKDKGSADGKFKILENLRKELRQLDHLEGNAEWPKLEKEIREEFFRLEDLVAKIKANNDESNFNMEKIEAELDEYRTQIELVLKDKNKDNMKVAKEILNNIGGARFVLLIYLIPHKFIQEFNNDFSSISWKNPSKARSLINQGVNIMHNNYNKEQLSDIVFALYQEMSDPAQLDLSRLTR